MSNILPSDKKDTKETDKINPKKYGIKPKFSNDKTKIADVFELPITVVNNVLY